MSLFARKIRPHVDQELAVARLARDPARAFRHLERAHVLGQLSTVQHTRVHLQMLRWALRQRAPREVLGQLLRIVGAATKTIIWVPAGNTGGANVSPIRPMPIPRDLADRIESARRGR